jgi:alpha/beta superfamily hydrolase
MLVGTAVGRFAERPVRVPDDTLIVHGEKDEVVPLAEVMDWARERALPVVVVPDGSHFFHGKLVTLKQLALARLTVALR